MLDRNGDGRLDAEEIDGAPAALRKLDRDGDGEVTMRELFPAPPTDGRPGARPDPPRARPQADAPRPRPDQPRPDAPRPDQPRRGIDFGALDKDGDGEISKDELPERMRERFDRMDRNGDGVLDGAEQEAVMRFIRQRLQEGRDRLPERDRGAGEGGTEKPRRPPSETPDDAS